jgi:hypothetical protein
MPPAAQFEFSAAIEEPYDGIEDVGGIEVEAVQDLDELRLVTRIRMLPRDHTLEECKSSRTLTSKLAPEDSRFAYFAAGSDKCLADSFDSVDEIEENSNEARLLKTLAARATVMSYNIESGLGEPYSDGSANGEDTYFLDETEAKYLDVLDRHLEDTDPESVSFSDLESGPDDPHPKKNRANMEQILEHLLDNPCCQCNLEKLTTKRLKSALLPPRWSNGNGSGLTPATSRPHLSKDMLVQFKEVDIREFKMTLGNHPSATSGPPVMLDWDCKPPSNVVDLNTYEKARLPRRSRRQLKLSLQERHNILVKQSGFTFEEVKGAWQEALEIRKQRKETLERGLAFMKWDEVWESTCRKFGRLVDGSA